MSKKDLKKMFWIFIPLLTAVTIFTPHIATSQGQQFTVLTDKQSYAAGDTITVTGTVPAVEEPTSIIIQIFDSENTVLFTEIPEARSDGTYSIQVVLTGSMAKLSGVYTVEATYGDDEQQTTFQFSGEDSGPKENNLVIQFSGGNSQSVVANLTNGFITNIAAVEESAALLLTLETGSMDGNLTIVLPRLLIDSKQETNETGTHADNGFAVFVDGDYSGYSETSNTTTNRTLSIPIPAGSQEVLIEGSSIMPEFSDAVVLLTSLSIGSIIAVGTIAKRLWRE